MNRKKQRGYWDFDLSSAFLFILCVGIVIGVILTLAAIGIWHVLPDIKTWIHHITA